MPEERKPPVKREFTIDLLYFLAAIFAVVVILDVWVGQSHIKTIPYSEFRSLIDKGER